MHVFPKDKMCWHKENILILSVKKYVLAQSEHFNFVGEVMDQSNVNDE